MEFRITNEIKERLNKSLEKNPSQTMREQMIENQQKEARANKINLKTQTDDDFNFYNRIHNLSFYYANKMIKERYKLDKSSIAKEKAISMELNLLKTKKEKSKNPNFYEYILSLYEWSIGENSIDEAIVLALLDKDVDIHYEVQNDFGMSVNLDSLLCGNQHNKKVIKKLLEKNLSLWFSNGLACVSDLCQLSVDGENLEKALEVFNDERYTGFHEYLLEALKENGEAKEDFDEKFNCTPLTKIILKLSKNNNKIEEKKVFLDNVLYGDKVKMLDVTSLKYIATMYSEEEYLRYLDYMKQQIKEDNLVVYSSEDDVSFFKETPEAAYEKGISYTKVNV